MGKLDQTEQTEPTMYLRNCWTLFVALFAVGLVLVRPVASNGGGEEISCPGANNTFADLDTSSDVQAIAPPGVFNSSWVWDKGIDPLSQDPPTSSVFREAVAVQFDRDVEVDMIAPGVIPDSNTWFELGTNGTLANGTCHNSWLIVVDNAPGGSGSNYAGTVT